MTDDELLVALIATVVLWLGLLEEAVQGLQYRGQYE